MRYLQLYICIFAFFIYLLTSIYCIHNSLPYMYLFSYHLCFSSMCCLIVYFIISCISIIYSFHIILYSYYSSIHIIYSLFICVFTIYLSIYYSFKYSLFTIHIHIRLHIYYSFTIYIRIYLRILVKIHTLWNLTKLQDFGTHA